MMDAREKDIQAVCAKIVSMEIEDRGDSGAWCPFCYAHGNWRNTLEELDHEKSCIYPIAKDLMTGFK